MCIRDRFYECTIEKQWRRCGAVVTVLSSVIAKSAQFDFLTTEHYFILCIDSLREAQHQWLSSENYSNFPSVALARQTRSNTCNEKTVENNSKFLKLPTSVAFVPLQCWRYQYRISGIRSIPMPAMKASAVHSFKLTMMVRGSRSVTGQELWQHPSKTIPHANATVSP